MSLLVTGKLVKYFGETHAVDHVDFVVEEGEVLALIGSNGAGKTTLVNLISGLLPADGGQIVFRGVDVTHHSVHERIRAGIARSFQLVNLFDQLSALDNIALSIFSRQGKTRRLFALADADTGKVTYFEGTPIPTSIVLVAVLGLAFYFDRVDEDIWFGFVRLGAATLHPLALMYAVSGSAMVSATLRIPKP